MEAQPYYDTKGIPINTIKHKSPMTVTVERVKSLVRSQDGLPSISHIVLNTEGKFKYWEGQSLGILPPGINEKTGKPNSVRLYSMCSTRYGDDRQGKTVSLCVRRAVHHEQGKEVGQGLCSNLLNLAKPGQQLQIVGPSGKVMILPEHNPYADIIMVGTGTGIAPFRAFWRRLFVEDTPAHRAFRGRAWMCVGFPSRDKSLYEDEWSEVEKCVGRDKFQIDPVFSREMTNKQGGRMYVQDWLAEHGGQLFERMENGAHIYFCGKKDMMPGITETLCRVSEGRAGSKWDTVLEKWKKNKQWHVEVY